MQINLIHFQQLTGMEFKDFAKKVLNGDPWGNFLKLASILETSCKRSIGLKLGLDPGNGSIARIPFLVSLTLCYELKLIPIEAYNFSKSISEVRNKLVHTNGNLELELKELLSTKGYNKYKKTIDKFIEIDNHQIEMGNKEHFNLLLAGTLGFIGYLSKGIFNDNWLDSPMIEN